MSARRYGLLGLVFVVGCEAHPPAPGPQPEPQVASFRFEVSKFAQLAPKAFMGAFRDDQGKNKPEITIELLSVQTSPGNTSQGLSAFTPYTRDQVDERLRHLKSEYVALTQFCSATMPLPVEVTLDGDRWTGFAMQYVEGNIPGRLEVIAKTIEAGKNRFEIQMRLEEQAPR